MDASLGDSEGCFPEAALTGLGSNEDVQGHVRGQMEGFIQHHDGPHFNLFCSTTAESRVSHPR